MRLFRAGTRKVKRQGQIEPPRDVISTKKEKILFEGSIEKKYSKKTMIITTYETINTIIIYIGSYDIYCIDVQLLKDNISGTVNTGYLTKARWDSICSLNEPFGNGIDTIIMIRALVMYIKDHYSNVKYLLFNDKSTKTCDDGNSVSLAAMKFLTDGKTWYEDHFDISFDDFNKSIYEKIKKNIITIKNQLSFDTFSMYSNIKYLNISDDILREAYNNSNTWQGFFSFIRNKIGISKLCIWLSRNNWLDIFLNTILKMNLSSIQFMLNIKQYDNMSYRIVNTTGGTRITMKNY
jgi:hypothetical protein